MAPVQRAIERPTAKGGNDSEEGLMNALAATLMVDSQTDEMSYEELVTFWQTRIL